jgi:DNA-binding response OmpR family regulator
MKETVLIIEDDKLMRISLEDALKGAGYDVMAFETGTAAMNVLKQNSYDVAIAALDKSACKNVINDFPVLFDTVKPCLILAR